MHGDRDLQRLREEHERDGGLVRGLVFALLVLAALILGGVAIVQASHAAAMETEARR